MTGKNQTFDSFSEVDSSSLIFWALFEFETKKPSYKKVYNKCIAIAAQSISIAVTSSNLLKPDLQLFLQCMWTLCLVVLSTCEPVVANLTYLRSYRINP